MGLNAMILVSWTLNFKPAFSLSFTFNKRLFSSSSLSAITVVSSAFLRLLIFLLAILNPACSSSQTFHMMYSQFSSVAQSCLTLCSLMDCSMPGFPVLHQFPEFVQTYVHRVGDVIQQSHPVMPFSSCPKIFPSIRVFSNESALHIRWPKLEFQLQHQSFQWIFRTDFL